MYLQQGKHDQAKSRMSTGNYGRRNPCPALGWAFPSSLDYGRALNVCPFVGKSEGIQLATTYGDAVMLRRRYTVNTKQALKQASSAADKLTAAGEWSRSSAGAHLPRRTLAKY